MYYIREKDEDARKYQRFLQYIDRNFKYISDFYNISTVTSNISVIFIIYRLTNNFDNRTIKKLAGINPAIFITLRNSAPNFSSTAVNTRLCALLLLRLLSSSALKIHRECNDFYPPSSIFSPSYKSNSVTSFQKFSASFSNDLLHFPSFCFVCYFNSHITRNRWKRGIAQVVSYLSIYTEYFCKR